MRAKLGTPLVNFSIIIYIGAEKFYIYLHRTKIALSALIATYLSKHTF
jgi:hypothetical protein